MDIKNCIKIKTLIILMFLMFIPFISYAEIDVPNPGGLFSNTSIDDIIGSIGNFIIGAIGILGIIFLVWGGILYVTSAGDDDQIEKAKTTIRYAIIGIFVAGFAYGIERILFSLFTAGL